ncbi:hypothetical protein O0I10_007107 [Lichtheimia ornata]|uniref:Uncharacterized protein n=1 Tax=Lichtheimia ornata TaxID=688661 RepID=A0AAD7XY93_9FUNG|nr:uncharacterized protein O0I10_007107 [Lichtheimia ornata]KAJ8657291.1 hypothetical protein O0I10_007107 [Lichtheimia ornata]
MSTENTKRFKWAKTFTPATSGRIQKKRKPRINKKTAITTTQHKRSNSDMQSTSNTTAPVPSSSSTLYTSPELSASPLNPSDMNIKQLEKELEYSLDTLATISVMYTSLLHAYRASKPELDRDHSATRLGEKEKELLTAYDDLGHQVTHLERHIIQLERRLCDLSADGYHHHVNNNNNNSNWILSPSSSPTTAEAMPPPLVQGNVGNDSPMSALPYVATPPSSIFSDDAIYDCSAGAAVCAQQQQPPLLTSLWTSPLVQQEQLSSSSSYVLSHLYAPYPY